MALNAQERAAAARALLQCFDRNAEMLGKFLAYLQNFAGINLLADVITQAATWQPFIDSGMTISAYQDEVTRYRDFYLASLA